MATGVGGSTNTMLGSDGRIEGSVEDGAMAGTVALGAASDQNAGIVNRSQFGSGQWQARRVA